MVDLSMLEWLEEWYQGQCNGDWEHQYGIKIDTIDNPGWEVSIDLHGTQLYGRKFTDVSFQYGEEIDWFFCNSQGWYFQGIWRGKELVEDYRTV
ncbi:immunity 53 family protein [Mesorhizobium sp. M0815]|uniref:Imm53 family immunity protein n=1 Tax=unclassified Mesorhizobium TaxID=325217 RepID=UPI00333A9EE5